MSIEMRDNPGEHRFELLEDGRLAAVIEYRLKGSVVDFTHTETIDGFERRGLASQLVEKALDDTRVRGRQVRPTCPFVRRFVAEHRQYADLVPDDDRSRFELT